MRIDNPIAQNLLIKQLERYQLKVTATSNGEEAIAGEFPIPRHVSWSPFEPDDLAWEGHDPGYFSVALFDHRKSAFLHASNQILKYLRHADM